MYKGHALVSSNDGPYQYNKSLITVSFVISSIPAMLKSKHGNTAEIVQAHR